MTWKWKCPCKIHKLLSSQEQQQQQKKKMIPHHAERKLKVLEGKKRMCCMVQKGVFDSWCWTSATLLSWLTRLQWENRHLQAYRNPIPDTNCLPWQLWEDPQEAGTLEEKVWEYILWRQITSHNRAMGTASAPTWEPHFTSQGPGCLSRDLVVFLGKKNSVLYLSAFLYMYPWKPKGNSVNINCSLFYCSKEEWNCRTPWWGYLCLGATLPIRA